MSTTSSAAIINGEIPSPSEPKTDAATASSVPPPLMVASNDVTNYDVLLYNTNEGLQLLSDEYPEKRFHVGNNRFQVLSQMHRREFEERWTAGMSTDEVVKRLIDIVCRQCFPTGRFLELKGYDKTNDKEWKTLSESQVQDFVKTSLANPPKVTPNALSASVPNVLLEQQRSEQSAAMAANHNSTYRTRPDNDFDDDDVNEVFDNALINQLKSNTFSNQSNKERCGADMFRATFTADGGEDNKKRRRRSSLLRRSLSEGQSATFSGHFSDKKKSSRRGFLAGFSGSGVAEGDDSDHAGNGGGTTGPAVRFQFPPFLQTTSWRKPKDTTSVTSGGGNDNSGTSPQGLDVVFNHLKTVLVTGHMGNNRLQIILDMQKDIYTKASDEDKNKSIQELIETVTKHWKGRFLSQRMDGVFHEISETQAELGLRALFGEEQVPDVAMSMTAQGKTKRPSVVKHRTLQALHRFQPTNEAEDMRSAAVASLQKKKQRQGLTTRIRNLTAGALGGGPSRAPRALSPINSNPGANAKATYLQRSSSEPAHTFAKYSAQPPQLTTGQSMVGPMQSHQAGSAFPQFGKTSSQQMSSLPVHQPQQNTGVVSSFGQQPPMKLNHSSAFATDGASSNFTPIPLSGTDINSGGRQYSSYNTSTDGRGDGTGDQPMTDPMYSHLSEGVIENLLSGLDVSESEFDAPRRAFNI